MEGGQRKAKEILAHEVVHLVTHQLHYLATCVYKDEGETTDVWESTKEIVGRLIYNYERTKEK